MISVLHCLALILRNPKSAIQCFLFDSKQIDYRTCQTHTAVSPKVHYDPDRDTANVRLALRNTSCIWSKGFSHD